MESQKNNVEDGFAAFSAFSPMQNRMNFDSTSSMRNQFSNKQDNLFQTLIKQAQVFEEFSKLSKRISLELQTSYQEYLTQRKESELVKHGKDNCNCKELIESQKQLIESLKARIKKLEFDSNLKNQDIKKLRQDINNYLELQDKESTTDSKRNSINSISFNNIGGDCIEKFNEKVVKNLDEKNNREDSWYYRKDEEFEIDTELTSKRETRNKNRSKQNNQIEKLQNHPPTYTITINEIIKKYTTKISQQKKEQKDEEWKLSENQDKKVKGDEEDERGKENGESILKEQEGDEVEKEKGEDDYYDKEKDDDDEEEIDDDGEEEVDDDDEEEVDEDEVKEDDDEVKDDDDEVKDNEDEVKDNDDEVNDNDNEVKDNDDEVKDNDDEVKDNDDEVKDNDDEVKDDDEEVREDDDKVEEDDDEVKIDNDKSEKENVREEVNEKEKEDERVEMGERVETGERVEIDKRIEVDKREERIELDEKEGVDERKEIDERDEVAQRDDEDKKNERKEVDEKEGKRKRKNQDEMKKEDEREKVDEKGNENEENETKKRISFNTTLINDSDYSSNHSEFHDQIQQIIARRENSNTGIKLKNFRVLQKSFSINDFIQYTKTNYFNSLEDDPKRILNQLIDESLLDEFKQQTLVLSQNLVEYTKRDIIPELPLGCNNYTMYEESDTFNKLNKCLKERVRKLITLEKRDSKKKMKSNKNVKTNDSTNNNVVKKSVVTKEQKSLIDSLILSEG